MAIRSKTRREEWEQRYRASLRGHARGGQTISGLEVQPLYTAEDLSGFDAEEQLGYPGEFPYTRGVYPSMYRGALWTMRQFAGFGSATETNARYRFLLEQGQTGLSVAFDMPTLMGYDSDDAHAEGEVGRCGVAVDSLDDMEALLRGIPLHQITTSMTINSPAAILLAMYVVTAEKQGRARAELGGTLQNDILKEYTAQKEYIFPPEPSLRLVTDTIEFCTREMPRWHPVSISGYHIREAGSTAAQELAFTLADGMAYVEAAIARGLPIDEFAPRLSFFFNAHIDFFEEVAKFRAARRIWARVMRDKYGARNPLSWRLRFHTQTAGCSLTSTQVENNVTRTAIEALAAVLGGTQSLHTNAMDEALALPTEQAALTALRTQQILAHETGVTSTVDPLGGSYYLEWLTNRLEAEAEHYFARIAEQGGVLACIENGFLQREIADAAFRYEREVSTKQRLVVGVNAFESTEANHVPILKIEVETERAQAARVQALRARRDGAAVTARLAALRTAAAGTENLMPLLIESVKVYATEGEIMGALQDVFGVYREPNVY